MEPSFNIPPPVSNPSRGILNNLHNPGGLYNVNRGLRRLNI